MKYIVIVILLVGLFFGGFLKFVDHINKIHPSAHEQQTVTDGIVVFTGGSDRVNAGVELLEAGIGKRLLISGVHPNTSAKDIAQKTDIKYEIFTCCIDLGWEAKDTTGNAQETRSWAKTHKYTSLRIVTTSYHIPRSISEMKRLAPHLTLIPHGIQPNYQNRTPPTYGAWFLGQEYIKYLISLLRWPIF